MMESKLEGLTDSGHKYKEIQSHKHKNKDPAEKLINIYTNQMKANIFAILKAHEVAPCFTISQLRIPR